MGTYTYAIMEVSKETYEEIAKKMVEAGYEHTFHETREGRVIDMHGIALKQQQEVSQPPQLTAGDIDIGLKRVNKQRKG